MNLEDSVFFAAESLHIIVGLIAAVIALVPVFTWKNRSIHVRSGRVFVITMGVAAVTALALALRTVQSDGVDFSRKGYAVFHIQLALAVLCTLQQGLFVFRQKRRQTPLLNLKTLALPLALIVASALVLLLGLTTTQPVYVTYAILGFILTGFQIRFWALPPQSGRSWLGFHLVNLLSCCSLTFTALILEIVTRLNGVPIEEAPLWIWMIPFYFSLPWMMVQLRIQEPGWARSRRPEPSAHKTHVP